MSVFITNATQTLANISKEQFFEGKLKRQCVRVVVAVAAIVILSHLVKQMQATH